MRWVMGIDESGYGPRIGPLVVGACVLQVPDAIAAVGDDLWTVFGDSVVRPRGPVKELADAGEPRPEGAFVGDSKLLFAEGWPDELERSALALLSWFRGKAIMSAADALTTLGVRIDKEPPWLAERFGRFPLTDKTTLPVGPVAARFGVKPVSIQARALSAAQYNRSCDQVGNKAIVNWALIALLIEDTLERADAPLEIVVDRQGGRIHYEDLLRELFNTRAEILEKSATRSAYAIPGDPRIKSIEFLVGGDVRAFCPAAASIVAKYVRELLMSRLNGFFVGHRPDLVPSGGYFSDGNRFVRETRELREELGITDAMFVRAR